MIAGRLYLLMSGEYLIPMNEYSILCLPKNKTIEEFYIPEGYEKVCFVHEGIIVKERRKMTKENEFNVYKKALDGLEVYDSCDDYNKRESMLLIF